MTVVHYTVFNAQYSTPSLTRNTVLYIRLYIRHKTLHDINMTYSKDRYMKYHPADGLQWVLQQRGTSFIAHYLDDFITLGPLGSSQCVENQHII